MTWAVTVGFMSLACGRIVRSGVASRVYLLGVDSLGVTQFGIALADDGFVGRAPNDDDVRRAFARSERALIRRSPLSRATHWSARAFSVGSVV